MIKAATALVILVALAGCSSIGDIRQGLDSPECDVRCDAARSLGGLQSNEETTTLLLKALEDPAPSVREGAADSLVQLLSEHAAPAILQKVKAASEPAKLAVIGALARPGAGEQASALLGDMLAEKSNEIRLAAAKALRTSTSPAKRPILLNLWSHDPDENVKAAALVSASYPAVAARKDEALMAAWRSVLADCPELLSQPSFLCAVGDLRIAEASPMLLGMLDSPELKYLAVQSLGKVRSNEAVAALLKILENNESWVMNKQVCQAIGRIRPASAAPVLAKLFVEAKPQTDKDTWDRTVFLTLAMSKIGGDEIFEAFASHITDKNKREFSLFALHRMAGVQPVWVENYWLYTWSGIESEWRKWWAANKQAVAERLAKMADEEFNGEE